MTCWLSLKYENTRIFTVKSLVSWNIPCYQNQAAAIRQNNMGIVGHYSCTGTTCIVRTVIGFVNSFIYDSSV